MAKKKDPATTDGYALSVDYLMVERSGLMPIAPEAMGDAGKSDRWPKNESATGIRVSATIKEKHPDSADAGLAAEAKRLNKLVEDELGGMLLPSGAHPFALRQDAAQDKGGKAGARWPMATAQLWSSGASLEIPFGDEQGFGRVHTAIRMVLPLLPAISAASPFLAGKRASALSARLMTMIDGTPDLPELTGPFIPEVVLDQADYYRIVLEPIARAITRRELSEVLDYQRLNGRAVIPSFDQNSISIHVADTQECPSMDAAIAEMTVAVINAMKNGRWVSNYLQRAWHENDLLAILKDINVAGGRAVIANRDYLLMFGMLRETATAGELWRHLYQQLRDGLSEPARVRMTHILDHGCLADRILRMTGETPARGRLIEVYTELASCLREDRPLS